LKNFKKYNSAIEEEAVLEDFSESQDIYGTVEQYMKLVNQFSLLLLFGLQFPSAYLISFIINIVDLQSFKRAIILDFKRPFPIKENSIGVWIDLLDLSALISILSNAGSITLASKKIQTWVETNLQLQELTIFLYILFFNFILKFIFSSVLGDMPFEFEMLLKRHQYLIRSTIENFKRKS
jgi:hypothetical protein